VAAESERASASLLIGERQLPRLWAKSQAQHGFAELQFNLRKLPILSAIFVNRQRTHTKSRQLHPKSSREGRRGVHRLAGNAFSN
jgi:hypothetical protein